MRKLKKIGLYAIMGFTILSSIGVLVGLFTNPIPKTFHDWLMPIPALLVMCTGAFVEIGRASCRERV